MAGRGSVLAHKFSANRAVAVMRRFREFFSGLVGLRLYTRTESLGEFSHLCPAVVMVPARARASGPPLAGLDGVDRSQLPIARERRFLCLRNADFRQAKVSAGARTNL